MFEKGFWQELMFAFVIFYLQPPHHFSPVHHILPVCYCLSSAFVRVFHQTMFCVQQKVSPGRSNIFLTEIG